MNQAVEVYVNHQDLTIMIYPFGDKFGANISRGHNGREEVICAIPAYQDKPEVLAEVRRWLEIASKVGCREVGDDSSKMSQTLIDDIIKRLEHVGVVSTFEFTCARM